LWRHRIFYNFKNLKSKKISNLYDMEEPKFSFLISLFELTDQKLVETLMIVIKDLIKLDDLIWIEYKPPIGKSVISNTLFGRAVKKDFFLFKAIRNLNWSLVSFTSEEATFNKGNKIKTFSFQISILRQKSKNIDYKRLFEQLIKIRNLTTAIVLRTQTKIISYYNTEIGPTHNIRVENIDKSLVEQLVIKYEPWIEEKVCELFVNNKVLPH